MTASAEFEDTTGAVSDFERVMRRHERQVLMTALRLLGSLEDAQDAAQEVFLRLYKHRRRLDEEGIRGWLYRTTVNVCRDIGRQRKAPSLSLDDVQIAGPDRDPDAAHARDQQRRIMAEALKLLPEKERVAVVLRDIEGLATSEVARILGSSETTVRSQISTARVKLKRFADKFLRRSA
jgi:RNA polymerase sigma-70 factor (ECF subfamily)